jgi:zinc transport system substrate-binding protein
MHKTVKYFLPLFIMLVMWSGIHAAFAENVSINSTTSNSTNANHSRLKIVASFYPIYEFVKRVGGNNVNITTLIPIGVEPHNFEPTIQQIQNAESADLIIYNGAGLEKWIDKIDSKSKVDASQGLNFLKGNDSESAGTYDPHVWLDPVLAEKEVENIRDALVKVDPANSQYYQSNANKFIAELNTLDNKIKTELTTCDKKDFIAFHNAFTYFANRYGLNQHSILGVTPEGEILPQRLQEIIQTARNLGLNIIYSEDLVDPRSAEVIAQEIPNGKVLILSPIEGINADEQKAGIGYLDKMNEDIDNLKIGLQCH